MILNDEGLRARALASLKKKRDFKAHLLAYVLVNAFLVTIWALIGANVFFWPILPIMGWGIGVAFNAWDVYGREPREAQIEREMRRLRDRTVER